jgi:hypothetical protein
MDATLAIRMDFASFEDYWAPYVGRDGPGAEYVALLSESEREALSLRPTGSARPVS